MKGGDFMDDDMQNPDETTEPVEPAEGTEEPAEGTDEVAEEGTGEEQ